MPEKQIKPAKTIYAIKGSKISELDFFKNKSIHSTTTIPNTNKAVVSFSFKKDPQGNNEKDHIVVIQFLKPTQIKVDSNTLSGVNLDKLIMFHPITYKILKELQTKDPKAEFVICPTYFGDFTESGSWSYHSEESIEGPNGEISPNYSINFVNATNSQSIETMNFDNNKINKSIVSNRDAYGLGDAIHESLETKDIVFFGFEIHKWVKPLEHKSVYKSQPLAVEVSTKGTLLGK